MSVGEALASTNPYPPGGGGTGGANPGEGRASSGSGAGPGGPGSAGVGLVGPHPHNGGPALMGGVGGGNGGGLMPHAPIALKAKEEILTSLHLIKDIRRLETYQRDFFLKVKESLNHVHLLLDHQLMDMAWSDNLIHCEESLLKASVHLAGSSPSQISEIYSLLLQDRDKLNHRFQELSVKSSLSEYVVNSRSLLDIETIHIAAESILRNEKPIQAPPDKSIPVDHTFFLANFCTTSIASSMLASFIPPKSRDKTTFQSAPRYEHHPSSSMKPTNHALSSHPMGHHPSGVPGLGHSGGSSLSNVPHGPPPKLGDDPSFYPPSGVAVPNSNGLYNREEFINAVVMQNSAEAAAAAVAHAQDELAKNVFGGHELVSAISQITRGDDVVSPPKPKSSSNSGPSHLPPGSGSRKMPTELWGGNGGGGAGGSGAGAKDEGVPSRSPGIMLPSDGGLNNGFISKANSGKVKRVHKNEGLSLGDGGGSESIPSDSEDGRNVAFGGAGGVSPGEFDASKPLSFARIASLNLEKQAVQRPSPQPTPTSTGQSPAPPSMLATAKVVGSVVSNSSVGGPSLLIPSGSSPIPMLPPQSQPSGSDPLANPAVMSILSLPSSNNPRYFFEISMEGKKLGKAIIEVEPAMAPKMAQNFGYLVTGERGYGYKGCQFFQAWKNESVICGDWEHNSGRGGRSALDLGPLFTPDETRLPCIRGAVGMRRMSKKHSSLNQVASQFRIILANMNTQFTGIFGRIIDGIEALDKVANVGGEGGRPEKIAMISACGIYKS
ncbi:hypothetical protein TCAL_01385 [Tigriopus californicus]|uniref:PPIase cyclophilin-type domain-containing protein n=1 Tax=Tigriopus californicus TaxID=6832 RepID=A0A553NSU5_TIGCA|nr:uncharacterized protein LOC131887103 [Tigriopus californicus]TRY68483.1 hypothetical protein TCAL_01385 [Tigriopus californicus]